MATGLAVPAMAKNDPDQKDQHDHDLESPDGPMANATVSFGAWPSGGTTPLDRFTTPTAPVAPNVHHMIPFETRISEGGSVNFVIAGFHVLAIYGPGTNPEDIDATNTIALTDNPPGFPQAVNDPTNRVYLGLNPFPLPQDRVEVVQFPLRGRYLVICAFLPHFLGNGPAGMRGYVNVTANGM